MDKQTEAMKLALEAITQYLAESPDPSEEAVEGLCDARAMLRKALAEQPAQQEPFGYFKAEPFGWTDCAETDEGAIALYERPLASKPLTNEEIEEVWRRVQANDFHDCVQPFARAIEAAHGITGEQK